MEATCEHVVTTPTVGSGAMSWVCGAPIPRLDEGRCSAVLPRDRECGWPKRSDIHQKGHPYMHAYLGPLASECTAGHPVAVPSDLHALADKALDALARNKDFDSEEWATDPIDHQTRMFAAKNMLDWTTFNENERAYQSTVRYLLDRVRALEAERDALTVETQG
jgi:hypothetical protein